MNRRGFLKLFGASALGAALAPEQLIWRPMGALPTDGVFMPPDALFSLHDITKTMAQVVGCNLGRARALSHVAQGVKIGDVVDGVRLTDTAWVSMEPLRTEHLTDGYSYKRYLKPAGDTLAYHLKHRNIRTFAPLIVPPNFDTFDSALATDEASGVTVRGLRFYDVARDQYVMRMDVLGARG